MLPQQSYNARGRQGTAPNDESQEGPVVEAFTLQRRVVPFQMRFLLRITMLFTNCAVQL